MKRKKLIIAISAILATLIIGGVIVYAAAYDSASDPLVALSYLTGVFKPSVDKDIKAVSDRVTAAETKISNIEKQIASGNIGGGTVDTTEIDNRLDALESANTLTATEITDLKAQLEAARGELTAAKNELEALIAEKASKADVDAVTASVNELMSAVNTQSERVDSLLATYGELLDALTADKTTGGKNYGFTTITLYKGERLVCGKGAAVMLRGGEGTYTACYDSTASENLTSGSTAPAEHIVIFDDGGSFETVSDRATIMVKGEYRVEG
ncbi:MAG: hypothetical protein E7660_01330 [Ruminococcaceae bacterium]|nr:hypothetical protein [Oscillospiraceae bacterium]